MTKAPTKTTTVIRAAQDQADELIVAGEVAEIRFPKGTSLSLLASKLFIQLLDLAGADVTEDRTHRATLRNLNWSHRDLAELEDVIHELHGTTVALSVNTRSGRRRRSGVVLADVDRPEDTTQGEIEWRFSNTFRYVVANSQHWAAISARAVLAMDCKYSPWLYQLAALHAGRKRVSEDWDLADLRERLGASTPSLRRWQDFKRRVLDPACAEINHLTGVGVSWEPIKHGRKVMGVRLSTWRKRREELDEATAELDRHRAGRRERREGLIERIEAERYAWRREAEAKLDNLRHKMWSGSEMPISQPLPSEKHRPVLTGEMPVSASPPRPELREAIAAAGVSLTPAQVRIGADQALEETGERIDAEAAYADWLRAAAKRKDRLRNPVGHWIDFCKRRAREMRDNTN